MIQENHFGRVPFALVDSGMIATLTGAESKTLLVICAHVNGKDENARPGIERITELSGLNRRTAERAVRTLAKKGILHIDHGGGRKRSNVYRVQNPGVQTGVCDSETPAYRPGIVAENPGVGIQKPRSGDTKVRGCIRIEQRKNRGGAKSATSSPASEDEFHPAPDTPLGDHHGNGAGARLMVLWVQGFKSATGRDFSQSARGKTAGTLKRLMSDHGEETLSAAVGKWFAVKRRDYGIELFTSRMNGGSVELFSPAQQGGVNDEHYAHGF